MHRPLSRNINFVPGSAVNEPLNVQVRTTRVFVKAETKLWKPKLQKNFSASELNDAVAANEPKMLQFVDFNVINFGQIDGPKC
jgi:hypothetical protein